MDHMRWMCIDKSQQTTAVFSFRNVSLTRVRATAAIDWTGDIRERQRLYETSRVG